MLSGGLKAGKEKNGLFEKNKLFRWEEKSRDRGIYGFWCFYMEMDESEAQFQRAGVRPDIFKACLVKSREKGRAKPLLKGEKWLREEKQGGRL